jgi:hypothetical protein
MAIQNAPGTTVQTARYEPLNPASFMPTQPYPLDMSLIQSPVGLLLKGMSQGMDMGSQIAGMPNAVEKLKAAKALTKNAEDAMSKPNDPASKAYSMDASGASQFRGKDAPMMPDVAQSRARAAVDTSQAAAEARLKQQEAEYYAKLHASDWDTAAGTAPGVQPMPSNPAVDAAYKAAGLPAQSGNAAPANAVPGVPSANGGTPAAAAPAGAGPAPGQGGGTVTIPQPTPAQPGQSHFTPDQIQSWWASNWSDTAKSASWSPQFNDGQGAWVVKHSDGSKDIVTDDLVMQNKGKWTPEIPLSSALQMSASQRQAGQLPSAPVMGSETPQTVDAQGRTTPASVPRPAPANAMPPAALAPQGQVPGAAPGNVPPLPNPQGPPQTPAPNVPPTNPNPNPAAAKASNELDLDVPDPDRERVGTAPTGMPMYKTPNGSLYMVQRGDDPYTETRLYPQGKGELRVETVPRPSAPARMAEAKRMEELKNEAATRGEDPNAPSDVLKANQRKAWLQKSQHQLDGTEEKVMMDSVNALNAGKELQKLLPSLNPATISAFGQKADQYKDVAHAFMPGVKMFQSDPDLPKFEATYGQFKSALQGAIGNGRITQAQADRIDQLIGSPASNPTTFGKRLETTLDILGEQFSTNVDAKLKSNYTVPDTYIEVANTYATEKRKRTQGANPQAAAPAPAATAASAPAAAGSSAQQPIRITGKDQLDAIPAGTWITDGNRTIQKPGTPAKGQ